MRTITTLLAFFWGMASFVVSIHATTPIPTVPIGNPGNLADDTGRGAVAYSYRIGTTEVTNAQYVAFLNAVAATDTFGLYSTSMDSDTRGGITRSGSPRSYSYAVKAPALNGTYTYDNKPVVFVSWGDAARFANWLHNGQPSGAQNTTTTEDGAYTLNGATSNAALLAVTRNVGLARWWIPSQDEWYKAAYHKNDGATGNYWDYPTGTDALPINNLPLADTGNSANFRDNNYTTGNLSYPFTDAGAYTLSGSPYGTYDQGGNIGEWNDSLFINPLFSTPYRGVRGGSWYTRGFFELSASSPSIGSDLINERSTPEIGFRVASLAVPEPGALILLATCSVQGLVSRRRIQVASSVKF